jgi:hypothetical protein
MLRANTAWCPAIELPTKAIVHSVRRSARSVHFFSSPTQSRGAAGTLARMRSPESALPRRHPDVWCVAAPLVHVRRLRAGRRNHFCEPAHAARPYRRNVFESFPRAEFLNTLRSGAVDSALSTRPMRRLVTHHQLASGAWSSAASCATTSSPETSRSPSDCGSSRGSSGVAGTGSASGRSRSMPSSLSRSRRSPRRTCDEPASPTARRCASVPRTPGRSTRTRSSIELSSTRCPRTEPPVFRGIAKGRRLLRPASEETLRLIALATRRRRGRQSPAPRRKAGASSLSVPRCFELRAGTLPRPGAWPRLSGGSSLGGAREAAALVLATQEFVANGGERPPSSAPTECCIARADGQPWPCRSAWLVAFRTRSLTSPDVADRDFPKPLIAAVAGRRGCRRSSYAAPSLTVAAPARV